jgi:hypothetical protein
MLQKVKGVLATIRAKRANEEAAEKLHMDYDEYVELKRNILLVRQLVGDNEDDIISALKIIDNLDTPIGHQEISHDIERGEAKISAVVAEEPRTPEDIVRLLKIDTKEWKLSQYWNKQKSDGWVISALPKLVALLIRLYLVRVQCFLYKISILVKKVMIRLI